MTGVDQTVQTLCSRALELGARDARPVAADEVVVDPRVALKCRVPLCSAYGRNLMCPPYAPSPGEFAAALGRYSTAIVVQCPIPLTAADITARYGDAPLDELEADPAYRRALAPAKNDVKDLLTELEREALGLGCPFAAGLGGGECTLCETCVAAAGPPPQSAGGEPGRATLEACRHPFRARPSMEAVGIDVLATAAAAGLHVQMPAVDDPVWTGLLLVQ